MNFDAIFDLQSLNSLPLLLLLLVGSYLFISYTCGRDLRWIDLKGIMNEALQQRRWIPRSTYGSNLDDEVLERGGFVAGLVNDGNTCFMNSVLQSLASSEEFMRFLDEEIITRIPGLEYDEAPNAETSPPSEMNHAESEHNGAEKQEFPKKNYGKAKKKTNRRENFVNNPDKAANLSFSIALKDLLDKLNDKYYKERPYFKTNQLLKTMSKSPKKNMLLGYDQEDAQEFFQTLLSELEKNIKSLNNEKEPPNNVTNIADKAIALSDLPEDAILGQSQLDHVGTVYLPTEQIDPNSVLDPKTANKFTPYKLITPFDGISAERIGCLQCGENGGIRYSVFSGLSLNLPNENIGSVLKLSELLNEWIKPEIIEGVECSRCALVAVLEHLNEQLNKFSETSGREVSEKLKQAIQDRIKEVEVTLSKPAIDDEDYKKLRTDNMIRKCSKSKQILIMRPPPLLSIHINRSVFDPRTYMILKNNSRVLFKSRLNLAPWCCDAKDINLDARLPMSRNEPVIEESSEDEDIGGEYYEKLHKRYEREFEDSDEEDDYEDDEDSAYERNKRLDVSGYDPLNGEMDLSSEDDESLDERFGYEVDALGNTINKGKVETSTEDNHVENDTVSLHDDNLKDDKIKGGYSSAHYAGHEADTDNDACGHSVNSFGDTIANSKTASENGKMKSLNLSGNMSTANEILEKTSNPSTPLTYSLRSVIVHYGTHNYGHYIAFRKFRGVWWRISDETVYIVEENEVLSTPGVFMLFYEYDYSGQKSNS